MTRDQLEAYVDAAAEAIGLPITPEHRPGVIANFERTAQFAALVNEFELPESLETAAIFHLSGTTSLRGMSSLTTSESP